MPGSVLVAAAAAREVLAEFEPGLRRVSTYREPGQVQLDDSLIQWYTSLASHRQVRDADPYRSTAKQEQTRVALYGGGRNTYSQPQRSGTDRTAERWRKSLDYRRRMRQVQAGRFSRNLAKAEQAEREHQEAKVIGLPIRWPLLVKKGS